MDADVDIDVDMHLRERETRDCLWSPLEALAVTPAQKKNREERRELRVA